MKHFRYEEAQILERSELDEPCHSAACHICSIYFNQSNRDEGYIKGSWTDSRK